jgi:hypothetical protein
LGYPLVAIIINFIIMPQLDKYIFFEHVISLTIFFFLIYIFIRGVAVPKISMTLKYRKKRLALFNEQLTNYAKLLTFSKSTFDKKSKSYILALSNNFNKINKFYENNAGYQL